MRTLYFTPAVLLMAYIVWLFLKRYISRNQAPSDYEPTFWDQRHKLKMQLRLKAYHFLTNLPGIRERCYQPRMELHAHPSRHIVRYGRMPDGQWFDYGSTIERNLDQAREHYYQDLRFSYRVKWMTPLTVQGDEFAPLPPAWTAMLVWDSERAKMARIEDASANGKARYWAEEAYRRIEGGELWMPVPLYKVRTQGRDWDQFISQPD